MGQVIREFSPALEAWDLIRHRAPSAWEGRGEDLARGTNAKLFPRKEQCSPRGSVRRGEREAACVGPAVCTEIAR